MSEFAASSESAVFEGPSFPEEDLIVDEPVDDEPEDDFDDGNRVTGGAARAVLEFVARSIVDDPESVHVDVDDGRGALKLSLHVAATDMGRIIGKRGRVAQAIRALVRAAAAREGTDATVDIVD